MAGKIVARLRSFISGVEGRLRADRSGAPLSNLGLVRL